MGPRFASERLTELELGAWLSWRRSALALLAHWAMACSIISDASGMCEIYAAGS